VRQSACPRLLLFPRYTADEALKVTPLSPAQAAFYLMQHLVNAKNLPDGGFVGVKGLAQQLRAFRLTYADVRAVAHWMMETVSRSS
jgi:hypothetical protein